MTSPSTVPSPDPSSSPSSSPSNAALTVPAVLAALARSGGSPALTWYGTDGERVELSGAVLDNWVTKTTNLLVEELDAGPGTRVLLDLPVHWRTAVWALAAWRTGATVALGAEAGGAADAGAGAGAAPDVVVTATPGAWSRAQRGTAVVAVALPALARRVDDLPAGAIDAAAGVMTYGDALGWVPAADPAAAALEGTDHAGLVPTAVASARRVVPGDLAGARVLVAPDEPARGVLELLGLWAGGASVVLAAPQVAAAWVDDPARRARVVGGERVTHDALSH